MKTIERQCAYAGILPYFFDERGIKKWARLDIKKALLKTFNHHSNSNFTPIPSVKVFYQYQPHFLPLNLANKKQTLIGTWQLQLENSTQIVQGKIKKRGIALPDHLPLGYHQLKIITAKQTFNCTVIVAPTCCYQPQALQEHKKLWGTFLQLYTLRSEKNWGIGDFGDLKDFIQNIARYQADFVGLNPIHSLFPANPEAASPYSPSSRQWINIAYIDINQLIEFQQNDEAQAWFNSAEIQQQLTQLRQQDWLDYSKILPLKLKGLRFAFAKFQQNSTACSDTAFHEFIKKGGEGLQIQATFDALHQYLANQYKEQWGWDFWAREYQDYHSAAVQQFRVTHKDEIEFYIWLQFIADQQLAACDAMCREQNMRIGMYRDLAVGVSHNGAETWGDKSLYCLKASIGAPPDILGPQGQNWGLTPMNPHVLKQRAYQPFIELLRANMQHCGALRIDHIMSLLRLWWIPKGDSAINGAYVSYPVDDLIAILALESQRHQCLIIGEDLGTVPKEIVSKLKHAGILSYKIFYFEFDEQGRSRALNHYPYQAMTTLSTHDLPTIYGYWQGYDFELGKKFGVYPDAKILTILQSQRVQAKEKILQRLKQYGVPFEADITPQLNSTVNTQFIHQLQRYVAHVNSGLFGFQPEDWLAMSEPVNIPGTSTLYANWRRRLAKNITDIFADNEINTLLNEVNKIRKTDSCT